MSLKDKDVIFELVMQEMAKIVYDRLLSLYESVDDDNVQDEGFSFNKDKSKITFNPSVKNNYADTDIFDENKELKVRKIVLPKSGVTSYNLYNINLMDINKALKHKTNQLRKPIEYGTITSSADGSEMDSIEYFVKRSVAYIKRILKGKTVDIITYPQTSKNKENVGFESFNDYVARLIKKSYPDSEGIKFVPEILIKNVQNIFVNVDVAKEVGLTDKEIHQLQKDVEKWKHEADIIALRKRLDILEEQIALVVKTRGKGRPSKDFRSKQQEVELIKQEIKLLKHKYGILGRDRTKDAKTGKAKDWEIKSLSDKRRRAIEGIFELNPKYKAIQYKFKGKHVVIFDDNLSSGATLDDVCLALQQLGVAEIIPITIGTIPTTVYGKERWQKHNADKIEINNDELTNMDWYFDNRSTDWDF